MTFVFNSQLGFFEILTLKFLSYFEKIALNRNCTNVGWVLDQYLCPEASILKQSFQSRIKIFDVKTQIQPRKSFDLNDLDKTH